MRETTPITPEPRGRLGLIWTLFLATAGLGMLILRATFHYIREGTMVDVWPSLLVIGVAAPLLGWIGGYLRVPSYGLREFCATLIVLYGITAGSELGKTLGGGWVEGVCVVLGLGLAVLTVWLVSRVCPQPAEKA